MPTVRKVTLSQPQTCSKCHTVIPAGETAVKDRRDTKKGTIYYHTECPKEKQEGVS
jgi:hypothetical protein